MGMDGAGVEEAVDEPVEVVPAVDVLAGGEALERGGARRRSAGTARSGDPPMTTSLPARTAGSRRRASSVVTAPERSTRRRRRRGRRRGAPRIASPSLGVGTGAGRRARRCGLTAPTPLGAQAGDQLGDRRRRSGRPPARVAPARGEASSSDVSVRPAWASPPGSWGHHASTRRPSVVSVATARSTASRLPPCPLTSTTPPAQSAERTSSTTTAAITSVPIDRVPGNPACSPLAVTPIVGATTTGGRSRGEGGGEASATIVSVPSGRCGPCCSHEPTGTQSTGLATSGHVVSVSRTASERSDWTDGCPRSAAWRQPSRYPHSTREARIRVGCLRRCERDGVSVRRRRRPPRRSAGGPGRGRRRSAPPRPADAGGTGARRRRRRRVGAAR